MSINYSDLVGSWRLVSFEISKDGNTRAWRSGATGMLLYTEDGHMSVSITSDIDPAADAKAVLDGILFYAGKARSEGDRVFHEVELASSPNRVGRIEEREAKYAEGKLTLTGHGAFGTAALVWRKQ